MGPWESVRQRVLGQISVLASQLTPQDDRALLEYFQLTTLGVLMTGQQVIVFSIGDGLYFINGEQHVIGPYERNQPPYLVYGLLPLRIQDADVRFHIHQALPVDEIDSMLIATDGLGDFVASQQRQLPGKDELVGPVSQFWTDNQFFTNPDTVRRRLFLVNSDAVRADWDSARLIRSPGLLPDDTTLITIRRR